MQKQVLLVDGSGYFFRAFHGLPPLMSPEGKPSGAVFGVLNMLRRLEQAYVDAHIVIVFDPPGPTYRHGIFSDYKANRSRMPDDLSVQIEPLYRLLRARGYPVCIVPGQEADDVIGTLARHYVNSGSSVIIATGDKDFTQLVSEQVVLLDTMQQRVLTREGVYKKFGVYPEQIIDYLALVGDASDNIPGVPKVGPKTAVKWLTAYGDMATLIEHAGQLKGKVGLYFQEAISKIPLYQALVTICQTVELPFDWRQLKRTTEDVAALERGSRELGFSTWLKDLGYVRSFSIIPMPIFVEDIDQLRHVCASLRSERPVGISFYVESISSEVSALPTLCALAIAQDKHHYFCALYSHDGIISLASHQVLAVLCDTVLSRCPVVVQEGKLLQRFCIAQGFDLPFVHDLSVILYGIQGPGKLSLPVAANMFLQVGAPARDEVLGRGAKRLDFMQMKVLDLASLLVHEALLMQRIFIHIQAHEWYTDCTVKSLYETIDQPLTGVLARMEQRGVMLDLAVLLKLSQEVSVQINQLYQQAFALAGRKFNPASVKQLQILLYDELGLPIYEKTPKGDPSTSESALTHLSTQFALPRVILEIRSLAKLKSTYIDALPMVVCGSRVHCIFQQTITATSRLSCQSPNLQNIPVRTEAGRAVRCAFIAPRGFQLVSFDYSQIELRIMAHISKDTMLSQAFVKDLDIHSHTAAEIFKLDLQSVGMAERRVAKMINFGLIYGMSAFGLAKQLGVDRGTAQAYIDQYFLRYPGVKIYMDTTRAQAVQDGYVKTVLGRKIYLPDIHSKKAAIRKAAERAAINAPMQGTAAEMIKLAMLNVQPLLQAYMGNIYLIVQVHDELIFEIHETLIETLVPKISDIVVSVMQLDIPLFVHVKVGNNWGELQ